MKNTGRCSRWLRSCALVLGALALMAAQLVTTSTSAMAQSGYSWYFSLTQGDVVISPTMLAACGASSQSSTIRLAYGAEKSFSAGFSVTLQREAEGKFMGVGGSSSLGVTGTFAWTNSNMTTVAIDRSLTVPSGHIGWIQYRHNFVRVTGTKAGSPNLSGLVPMLQDGSEPNPGLITHQARPMNSTEAYEHCSPGTSPDGLLMWPGYSASDSVNGGSNTSALTNNMLVGSGSGKCLDVPSQNWSAGNRIHLWECNRTVAQLWTGSSSGQLRVNNNSMCLDGGAGSSGSNVVIMPCNNTPNQQWKIGATSSIVHQQTGLCLDAYGGAVGNGTAAVLWPCTGGTNQSWLHVGTVRTPAGGAGSVNLVFVGGQSGKCLDVAGGQDYSGNVVQLWECNQTAAQRWTVASDGSVRVFNDKCLTADGAEARAVIRTCNGSSRQKWSALNGLLLNFDNFGRVNNSCIDRANYGTVNGTEVNTRPCRYNDAQNWYRMGVTSATLGGGSRFVDKMLSNSWSRGCLDVRNGSDAAGTIVQNYSCNASNAQLWALTSAGALKVSPTGYYELCLDASNQGTAPGTPVIIWDCNGGANQKWDLNAVGELRGAQSGLCVNLRQNELWAPLVLDHCQNYTGYRWSVVSP